MLSAFDNSEEGIRFIGGNGTLEEGICITSALAILKETFIESLKRGALQLING